MKDGRVQVLFVALGASRIAWYRVVLPATYLGVDWAGFVGEPPHLGIATSYVQGETKMPRFEDYDVVVMQQPEGPGWFGLMCRLQALGIKVLFEIDDWLHGIRKQVDHDFREAYPRDRLARLELCMRRADGLIVSTEYLARRYRRWNRRVWVCENGLDMGRYRLTRPPERPLVNGRPSVTLMWSGATGHMRSIAAWLQPIENLMERHDHVRFISIGVDIATPFQILYGARAFSIPFAFLETYPSAMMVGDVALAPALATSWVRGKSALRAMEAAALGMPVVAAPVLYANEVLHGRTGFLAETPVEVEAALEQLIQDDSLRFRMGDAARAHSSAFDMRFRHEQWKRPILEVLGLPVDRAA